MSISDLGCGPISWLVDSFGVVGWLSFTVVSSYVVGLVYNTVLCIHFEELDIFNAIVYLK